MQLRVLGPVEVVAADRAVAAGPPQQCAVLAALAVDAGRSVPVDVLVDRVWGATPPEKVRRTLHTHITRIRRLLEQSDVDDRITVPVLRQGGGYTLEIDPDQVDLHRFRRLVDSAREPDRPDGQRVPLLSEALRLWRGQPLAGVPGQWATRMRQMCQHERVDAVVAWAQAELRLGNPGAVIGALADLVDEHPLVESLTAMLMRALHATGRNAQALDRYTTIRRRLVDQLGVDPGAELQQLHQAILRGDLDQPAVPAIPAQAPPLAVPAQLPMDIPGFTGRTNELARLDTMLSGEGRHPRVSTLSGTAGVGKTALAVHWARRVADRFPDGQLYVNMRGFDPSGAPTTPEEALRGFLDAFEVPASRIPATLQGQVGLYRSLLANRRVLVVLDNARDADQVRPLLPGAPACLAIITSRNRLSGLVAAEGADPIGLELPSEDECRSLLTHRLGTDRITNEPEAVDDIIAACARLPLALAIVAARASTHPGYSLAVIAKELHDARGSLEAFVGDDPATDARAVFSVSYRILGRDAAHLFRLMAIHPGPDISPPATASLTGLPPARVRPLLAELTHAHLLTEPTPGRYTFHDLLRAYATEQAHIHESDATREAATDRMVDHYLHTAHTAADLMYHGPKLLTIGEPQPGTSPEVLAGYAEALAWFAVEHGVLLAVVRRAADLGLHTYAWQLGWTLKNFWSFRGRWHEGVTVQRIALTAAERLGDHEAQARCHRSLGDAYSRLGRYDDAHTHLGHALELCQKLGDHNGQAHTRLVVAIVLEQQGRHRDALRAAQDALERYQIVGEKWGQARSLNSIAWLEVQIGDYAAAVTHCARALAMAEELGDRYGQAATLDTTGYAHHHLGDHERAIECYLRALDLLRDLGHRYHEANVLGHLGDTRNATGDRDAARTAWRQALHIFDELGHPDAVRVRVRLNDVVWPRW